MTRVLVLFGDKVANIPAEEFHEDGEFIKIYGEHQELVGMFKTDVIDGVYRTESGAK